MSLENVANEDCTIDHSSGSVISGGSFTILSAPSTKVKANTKGVYRGNLQVTFSGGDATGFIGGTVVTTAPVTITATAQKVKADNQFVMRAGDSALMNCIGNIDPPPTPPASPTGPVAGNIEISDAGQDKVKSE